eukprot:Gregarina_sp_Poly_1__5290@NODE_279_length_10190_cov_93_504495_g243_i0_p1_GENE_NODE_279_length_10190_cov_93_504495_g243_i0NODE_279_length_10190_cov_93_504495_g243_i0_p1_ORF_typecomplete_len572_score92_57ERremodelling/PF14755_6/5_3e03ERremodelling/PF14755_6/4_8e03ERremodelling/PF14755_6/0_0097Glyco_trans_1_2/PF13524_6/5e03Glyco_trans_1_2/PF13524_6/0_44DUF5403/PF17395_2/1_3e04DUF5403/PF17395_2/0_67Phage_HK97_TLTM/PF06120_11/2_5e02DUF4023/PF13215_6/5_9e03DUF4023/PF13215_6/0_51RBDFIP/PF09457_10/0_32R
MLSARTSVRTLSPKRVTSLVAPDVAADVVAAKWIHAPPRGNMIKRVILYHSTTLGRLLECSQREGFKTEIWRQLLHELWKILNNDTFEFAEITSSELAYAVKCMSSWDRKLLGRLQAWHDGLKQELEEEENLVKRLKAEVDDLLTRVEDAVIVDPGVKQTNEMDSEVQVTATNYFQAVEKLTRLAKQERSAMNDLIRVQIQALDSAISDRRMRLMMAGRTQFNAVDSLTTVRNEIASSQLPLDPLKSANLWQETSRDTTRKSTGKARVSRVALKLPNEQNRQEATQAEEQRLTTILSPVTSGRNRSSRSHRSLMPAIEVGDKPALDAQSQDSMELLHAAFGDELDLLMDYIDGHDNELNADAAPVFPQDRQEFVEKMQAAVKRRAQNRERRAREQMQAAQQERTAPVKKGSVDPSEILPENELEDLTRRTFQTTDRSDVASTTTPPVPKKSTSLTSSNPPSHKVSAPLHEEERWSIAGDTSFIPSAPPTVTRKKRVPLHPRREEPTTASALDAIRGVDRLKYYEEVDPDIQAHGDYTQTGRQATNNTSWEMEDSHEADFQTWQRGGDGTTY